LVYFPAVSQPSRLESTNETKSSGDKTFPETGTAVSPGMNGVEANVSSANSRVRLRMDSLLVDITYPKL